MSILQKLWRMGHNTLGNNTEGDSMPDEMDTQKASTLYEVSENYIRKVLREGKIKGRKLRRDWLVDAASLKEYMSAGRKWKRKKPK